MSFYSLVRRVFHSVGLEICRWRPERQEYFRVKCILEQIGVNTILDIGANTGQFAQGLISSGFEGRIISFEPQKDEHALLMAKAAGNSFWTVASRCAVGDVNGKLMLNKSGNSVSSSLLPMLKTHEEAAEKSRVIGEEMVPVHRLDQCSEVMAIAGDVFAKIDTQGFELHVLRGAVGIMHRMAGVMIEASLVPLYEGQPLVAEVMAFLDQHGFVVIDVIPEFHHPENGQMLQVNLIAIRKTRK